MLATLHWGPMSPQGRCGRWLLLLELSLMQIAGGKGMRGGCSKKLPRDLVRDTENGWGWHAVVGVKQVSGLMAHAGFPNLISFASYNRCGFIVIVIGRIPPFLKYDSTILIAQACCSLTLATAELASGPLTRACKALLLDTWTGQLALSVSIFSL